MHGLFSEHISIHSVIISVVVLYLRHVIHRFFLWRMLWRNTIRGNLKMVLIELMCRTAVCKVLLLRWSVFRGLGSISLWFFDVLWEFQKPEEEFLSSLLFYDVELVVMSQSPGHFLIGHIVSVLMVAPETR